MTMKVKGSSPRVAVVGLGVHAHSVLLPCLTIAGARLCGVYDSKLEHARTFSVPAEVYRGSNLDDLIEVAMPDCAIVAAPPEAAADLVGTLIERRIPTFVEKPVSLRSDEVIALADRAEAAGTSVQVGFNRRFAPAYRQLRSMVMKAPRPVALTLGLAVEATGGLSLFLRDAAIHQLDLCRYLLGDVAAVTGVRADGSAGARFVSATVTGSRGVATLHLCGSGSWGSPTERAWADLDGTGVEVTDVSSLTVMRAGRQSTEDDRAARFEPIASLSWRANLASPRLLNNSLYLQGYLPELQQFCKAVALGAPMTPGLRDSVAALDLADQLMALPAWEDA